MTTENEVSQEATPRDVSVLLELDTYQGMTDAEIQSLIDWHERRGYDTALSTAQLSILKEHMDEMVSGTLSKVESIESMVQSIVNRNVNMLGVEG